jgi:hypothetical protein
LDGRGRHGASEPGFRRERICNMVQSARNGGGQRRGYGPISAPVSTRTRGRFRFLLTTGRLSNVRPLLSCTVKRLPFGVTDDEALARPARGREHQRPRRAEPRGVPQLTSAVRNAAQGFVLGVASAIARRVRGA